MRALILVFFMITVTAIWGHRYKIRRHSRQSRYNIRRHSKPSIHTTCDVIKRRGICLFYDQFKQFVNIKRLNRKCCSDSDALKTAYIVTKNGDKIVKTCNGFFTPMEFDTCAIKGENFCPKCCKVNLCDVDNPCLNSGTCVPSEGGVSCSCPPTFPGIYCEKIDCNFDENYCTWKQSWDNSLYWIRRKGQTPTENTGPQNDHTGDGSYIYIEASVGHPNQTGMIESPEIIQSTATQCLSFWYHMFGKDMGDLNVYIKTNQTGLGDAVWTRGGNQGNVWKRGYVNLSQIPFLYSIVFEGIRGSDIKSDIALDDITFVEGVCQVNLCDVNQPCLNNGTCVPSEGGVSCSCPPTFPGIYCEKIDCNFDESYCGWKQLPDDIFDWTRNKGPTNSERTGPPNDHTGNGSYIYIEASNQVENDKARIESPEIIQSTSTQCLSFWYHMYGEDMGDLNVYIKTNQTGLGDAVFTRAGDQGNVWKRSYVNVSQISSAYSIVFEGVRGSDVESDIAIDDVTLVEGGCQVNLCDVDNPCLNNGTCVPSEGGVSCSCPPTFPGIYCEKIDCNFDESYCGWKQSSDDIFDWTRNNGPTNSGRTGPPNDHTGGGSYIYIEASNQVENDKARIESPEIIQPTSTQCLSFWYHMYGNTMGDLNVYIKTNQAGLGDAVFTRAGDMGDVWKQGYINLSQIPSSYSIVFEGVSGSDIRSDIAIDDVTLVQGDCPGV
ncbi:MAM and LDL-receptor class A domain-containing protein 2 [Patella vulgata]|uniref:MAM and LDL-receptor class A domain-containing protein 2 n=1 Tax=Patella vulgata TaxID=6465 RepID=UPI0024A93CD5|nr:MAM and LDL-receptor class A domain-containing protein 2 [Patella vulgata]